MRPARGEHGATFSDVLVFVATLSLALALLYPAWSAREFRERVSAAVTDVQTVGDAARQALSRAGRWPTSTPPGTAPQELVGLAAEGSPFSRTDYRVGWTSWNVVDSIEVMPTAPGLDDVPPEAEVPQLVPVLRSVGGISVHSADPALLAELSDRFSGETSFVLDTMWMLVLTERGEALVR